MGGAGQALNTWWASILDTDPRKQEVLAAHINDQGVPNADDVFERAVPSREAQSAFMVVTISSKILAFSSTVCEGPRSLM